MKLFLRSQADPTKFTDAADYSVATLDNPPFPAPDNFEWVEGEPEGTPFVLQPLDVQLDLILDQLPMEVQTQFAPLIATGKVFIDTKRLDRLQALIEATPVPPELEAIKAAMLEKLSG